MAILCGYTTNVCVCTNANEPVKFLDYKNKSQCLCAVSAVRNSKYGLGNTTCVQSVQSV